MDVTTFFSFSWKQWVVLTTGGFFGLTLIGYFYDNYWDPSSKRKKDRNVKLSKLPPSKITKLESDNPTLTGEKLFKKIIQTGEQLENLKKDKQAENYFLRLYDLAKVEADRNPPDVGKVLLTFALHYLVKNYRNQKKWELAESCIEEMLEHREALQDPIEWEISLVDILLHQKRFDEALLRGKETKANLHSYAQTSGNEGRVGLFRFMLHEKFAEIYSRTGDIGRAAKEISKALSTISPHTGNRAVQLELDLITLYLVQGKRDLAKKEMDRWSDRPEIRNKGQFLKDRFIAGCYFDANLLDSAKNIFEDIKNVSQNRSNSKTEYEQAVNSLIVIAHDQNQPDRVRELYGELRKQPDLYAYTQSKYFQTAASKFLEKGKVGPNSRGTWKLTLEIKRIYVKGIPSLTAGAWLSIATETMEGEEEIDGRSGDFDENIRKNEEQDLLLREIKEGPLKSNKTGMQITKEMLDKETVDLETSEVVISPHYKILIEIEIFSDRTQEKPIGVHHQFVCLMVSGSYTLSSENFKQPKLLV